MLSKLMNKKFELDLGKLVVGTIVYIAALNLYDLWRITQKAKADCETPNDGIKECHRTMYWIMEILKRDKEKVLVELSKLGNDDSYKANDRFIELIDQRVEIEKMISQNIDIIEDFELSYPILKEEYYTTNPSILLEDK